MAKRQFLLFLALVFVAWSAVAQPAPARLLITGKLAGGRPVDLTMADLQAMPQRTFTTRTPWYKDAHTFSGPLLRDVLARAGAQGARIKAVALNDYQVTIPVADPQVWDMIVAIGLDGQPMAVREKGPFFVIYPFDSDSRLQSQAMYARSIWQLKTLSIE